MIYKLMVSYDCGMNYHKEMVSENIDDFKERCDECDKDWLRWCIESESGELLDVGAIHKKILHHMRVLNKPTLKPVNYESNP